jgi:hypothetical protein
VYRTYDPRNNVHVFLPEDPRKENCPFPVDENCTIQADIDAPQDDVLAVKGQHYRVFASPKEASVAGYEILTGRWCPVRSWSEYVKLIES